MLLAEIYIFGKMDVTRFVYGCNYVRNVIT